MLDSRMVYVGGSRRSGTMGESSYAPDIQRFQLSGIPVPTGNEFDLISQARSVTIHCPGVMDEEVCASIIGTDKPIASIIVPSDNCSGWSRAALRRSMRAHRARCVLIHACPHVILLSASPPDAITMSTVKRFSAAKMIASRCS